MLQLTNLFQIWQMENPDLSLEDMKQHPTHMFGLMGHNGHIQIGTRENQVEILNTVLYYISEMKNGMIIVVIKFLVFLLMFLVILSKIVYSYVCEGRASDFLQCEFDLNDF